MPFEYAYADVLQKSGEIKEIRCNVILEGYEYTSDFVCIKTNQDIMVQEQEIRQLGMTVELQQNFLCKAGRR